MMVTAEDYARAERLLWPELAGGILNATVAPTWIGETELFWYRRDTGAGHEYVLVDAATGARRSFPDHAALALSLAEEFGEPAGDTAAPGPDAPAASPDGRWTVLARGGDLWLRDLAGGTERQLTSDGAPDDGYGIYPDTWGGAFILRQRAGALLPPLGLQWAPDSARLIAPRIDQRHVRPYPFVEWAPQDGDLRPKLYQPRIPLMGERPAQWRWFVVDVPSGARRPVEPPAGLAFVHPDHQPIHGAGWSADGRCRYVLARGENLDGAALCEIDLASGAVRTLIEERTLPRTLLNGVVYNPPNVWLAQDAGEAIWYSQRDGRGHLYLYDTARGVLKGQITKGAGFVRDLIAVDPVRREILFTASGRDGEHPYYRVLYRVNFDGGGLVRLTHEPMDQEIAQPETAAPPAQRQLSPSRRYMVHSLSTVDQPPRSVVRSLDDGRIVAVLEEADIGAALDAGYRPPQPFSVKAADGVTDLHGVLHLPTGLDPPAKCPLIVSQYTSPIGPASPKTFVRAMVGSAGPVTPAALAALGFAVMSLDPRAAGLRSREIDAAIEGRLNIIGMDDYAAAIAQLGERHPRIDTSRVGIYGGSYGGFAVIRAMLEYPAVFKVGIAASPPAALQTMYPDFHWQAYQGEPVYADGGPLRTDPAAVPVNYEAVNANAQAARLEGRLLIIFGEQDENVPPSSPLQFIAALIEADRPFDMLMLPNATHGGIWRTRHVVRRQLDYFVRHLLGAEPPADFRFTRLRQAPAGGEAG